MQIKIQFRNETKKVKNASDYSELVHIAQKIFQDLPMNFRFFYVDQESDMISISSQEDYEEALECFRDEQTIKMLIAESNEEAIKIFDNQNQSLQQSFKLHQMPLQMPLQPLAARIQETTGQKVQDVQESDYMKPSFDKSDRFIQQLTSKQDTMRQQPATVNNQNQVLSREQTDNMDFEEVKSEYDFQESRDIGMSFQTDRDFDSRRNTEIPKVETSEMNEAQQISTEMIIQQQDDQNLFIERKETQIRRITTEQFQHQETVFNRIDHEQENEFDLSRGEQEEGIQINHEVKFEEDNIEIIKQEIVQAERKYSENDFVEVQKINEEPDQVLKTELDQLKEQIINFEPPKEEEKEVVEEVQEFKPNIEKNEKQDIVCFKCDGKKVNHHDKVCRKCGGTGQLNSSFLEEIKNILKDEIKQVTPQLLQMLKQNQEPEQINQNIQKYEHKAGNKCTKCGCVPLFISRYRCFTCLDLMLCETCEKIENHSVFHAMILIRSPNLDPFIDNQPFSMNNQSNYQIYNSNQLIAEVRQDQNQPIQKHQQEEEKQQIDQLKDQMQNPFNIQANMNQQVKQSNYSKLQGKKKSELKARFIKENFADNYTIKAGHKFNKTWTFRNDGTETWPQDIKFIYTNGDKFGQLEKALGREVKPNEFVDVTIEFMAPSNPGKFTSFYRFVLGNNERFGQKVWCDIQVIEPEDEIIRLQKEMGLYDTYKQPVQPRVVQSKLQEIKPQVPINQPIVQPPSQPIVINEQIIVQPPSQLIKEQPKQQYQEMSQEDRIKIDYLSYVESMLSKNLKESMLFLLDMGYPDYKNNEQLLMNHGGRLDQAVNDLARVQK